MFRDQIRYGRDPNVVVRASDTTFKAPLKWKEPHGIFTCSWSDFFIEESDPWRNDAYRVMQKAYWHTYLILTKRPERMEPMICGSDKWIGVSVENRMFYKRIETLVERARGATCFLSVEPLLGPMPDLPLDGIHWVIVGGESGPGFRPLNMDWVRQIRDRCVSRGIAFFFKQKSDFNPKRLDRLIDGREWNEIPKL
jgi:protein gp37